MQQFDTDSELFEAVYDAVPQDYRRARGARRELIWALLYLKKYWMIWPPCWKVEAPDWEGYISVPAQETDEAARIAMDMLDSEGTYRGRLHLVFPDSLATPVDAAELAARLLYWASFVPEGRENDAAESASSLGEK